MHNLPTITPPHPFHHQLQQKCPSRHCVGFLSLGELMPEASPDTCAYLMANEKMDIWIFCPPLHPKQQLALQLRIWAILGRILPTTVLTTLPQDPAFKSPPSMNWARAMHALLPEGSWRIHQMLQSVLETGWAAAAETDHPARFWRRLLERLQETLDDSNPETGLILFLWGLRRKQTNHLNHAVS